MTHPSEINTDSIDTKKVQEHFDKAASQHRDKNAVLDSAAGDKVAFANIYRDYFTKRYIRKNLSPNKNDLVLDFGCGIGRITYFLSPFVKKIEGIDSSQKMIELANENIHQFQNVHFTLLKHNHLQVDSNTIDKVISNWVLQHISDDDCKNYFHQFFDLLKPGGKIFLFEQVKNTSLITDNIHFYRTVEEYRQLISSAGFQEVIIKPAMKVPARGMSIWNKLRTNSHLLLWCLSLLDELTIHRKPQLAEYYTYAFIFEKKKNKIT